MAQYYQIVGQGQSLTLEDLQRYCPTLSLDGIILNQDGQQYARQQVVVQQTEPPNDIIVSEGVQSQLVVSDGLQYQQQYIIRHEPPPPPPPPRPDFQQQQNQQQHQQHQQQQLQHRQVYYTSDLPVDAQVVLQQAQQIIDASMMQQQQQSSPQRPQHQLVSPAHVLSQPTVIHPAQQPPPQPPPSTPTQQHAAQHVQHVQQHTPQQHVQQQHTPQQHAPQQHTPQQTLILQPQQQPPMSRASPQLLQHLQQQQHQQQIHLQLQQQQLQHQLQQHQQVQHMSPQQQLNINQQHQQVVMHAAYINQSGSSNRPPPQRLLNPSLNPGPTSQIQGNQVTLVRSPTVRTVRPRRPAARASLPASPRPLNPMVAGTPTPTPVRVAAGGPRAPPRVLNATLNSQPGAQPRTQRPRTPMHPQQMQHQVSQQQQHPQQQHPQHQLVQHSMAQQVHQMNQPQPMNQSQSMNQPQPMNQPPPINQLKLSTIPLLNQQIPIPQSTRIITPQGTIVTHNQPAHQMAQQQTSVPQSQNGPMPQSNVLPSIQHRASPHPQQVQQVKVKVVAQTNAGDMDDLEESITAAIVQKHQPTPTDMTPQQFHSPSPAMRPNLATTSQGLNFNTQHYQQMAYEQHAQHPQTLTQLLMEPDPDEDRQVVTLNTGQRITLAEYKRLQQTPRTQVQQQQQARESGRQTLVRSKEQPRPVQRVQPMQTQQQVTQHESNEAQAQGPSEQAAETQSAKMLIFLQNGEQRLITFTLPKESCTLQEVLEQVNVPFSEDTHIQCMQNTSSEIDYFVSVGSTTRIEEMLENHPMLVGDISSRSSPSVMSQPQSSEMSTPEKSQSSSDTVNNGPESPGQRSPPPRHVDGMLAVCKSCGYTGFDFSRCERCRRVFTEEPKGVPVASKKAEQKKKETERTLIEKPNPHGDGIKINLLKTNVKTIGTKAPSEKKPTRVRKPRGKPEPEPVILTLSSDEEDSNSSFTNQYEASVNTKEPSLSEIEGTPDSGIGMDMDDGSREEVNPTNMQGFATSFNCRTIRIGSYRYTPKEKVSISARGIKIVAPSLKNESRDMALQINLKEVVRILVHFGKGLPVIFLYTMIRTGQYIRNSLDMVEDSGPYYDPMSKVDPFKRITLLPETITEDCKVALKALFGKVMDELNSREANDILVRTCPKESNSNVTKMTTRSCSVSSGSGAKSSNPAEIRQILIYPPGKGGIPINTEDYMCLAQDQFLNDVIIDFYLKYLVHDVLTHSQRERTHIFSTFFYKRLTTKPCKVNKSSNPHEWDSALTPSQKRHARVKTWTKNVNIFEKDYIVVPINENCHWFVAIICFPSLEGCRSMVDNRTVNPQEIKKRERRSSMLIGNTTITPMTKQEQLTLSCDSDNLSERDEAEADESDLDMQCDSDEEEEKAEVKVEVPVNVKKSEPIKQPCILIFDSLAGASRSRVVATLRDYLTCEYQAKISSKFSAKIFNKDNIKGSCPKIPQQNNFTDCGLYLLHYVEQFFKDPVVDYAIPIKQLSNWFDEIVVTRKREEISNLLKTLMHKFNPDSHLALPDITFPTLNGKLIEPEEGNDDSSENEKGSSSKHKSDGKESDGHTLLLRQMPTGDIVVKRNYADNTETIHLRKTIRLSSDVVESRSMLQIKQELFKKGDSENQILIPIKLHTSDIVKDIQNTLIVNKNNKTMVDKKHSLHNQNSSNINSCMRQSVGESDTSSFLKGRRTTKIDDVVNESNKKFKRNEC